MTWKKVFISFNWDNNVNKPCQQGWTFQIDYLHNNREYLLFNMFLLYIALILKFYRKFTEKEKNFITWNGFFIKYSLIKVISSNHCQGFFIWLLLQLFICKKTEYAPTKQISRNLWVLLPQYTHPQSEIGNLFFILYIYFFHHLQQLNYVM